MKSKVLKDVVLNQRTMRKELSFLKKNPEQRKPALCNVPTSSVVAFSVEGETLMVVGFR
jgi:hypothetical protein